ncbi:hypothetical protein BMJ21_13710 [Sinorhizobium medicae]|nr:hypothetical protein BMJ21_13710 [Sinorhizobium medicae]
MSAPPPPVSKSLPSLPLRVLAESSPVSVSLPLPPNTFSMFRIVSSATPPTKTKLSPAPKRVTSTAAAFSR